MLVNEQLGILGLIFIIWLLIYCFILIRKRDLGEKVKVGPLYFYLRSERMVEVFSKFSQKHERQIRFFLTIGTIVCFLLMIAAIYILLDGVLRIIVVKEKVPAVVPVIPGITISFETFLKIIPAIVIVLFPHEYAHKIAFDIFKLRVKSIGAGMAIVFPFAFVEPDEEKFKKSKSTARLRILAAGSFINLLTTLIFLPPVMSPQLYSQALSPYYEGPNGILVVGIAENSPLDRYTNIKVGDVIIRVNNVPIRTIDDYIALKLEPNVNVTICYIKSEDLLKEHPEVHCETLVTDPHPLDPSRGIIGILVRRPWPLMTFYRPKISILPLTLPQVLYEIINWCFILAFSVALFNMLPIPPLDGYPYLEALMEFLGIEEKRRKMLLQGISGFAFILLAFNLIIALVRF